MAPEKPEAFARIVSVAVTLAEIALDGSDMDRVSSLFAQVDALSKNADALVNKMMEGLVARIQKTAESFSVELGSVENMQANFEDMSKAIPDLGARMSFTPMARDKFQ